MNGYKIMGKHNTFILSSSNKVICYPDDYNSIDNMETRETETDFLKRFRHKMVGDKIVPMKYTTESDVEVIRLVLKDGLEKYLTAPPVQILLFSGHVEDPQDWSVR